MTTVYFCLYLSMVGGHLTVALLEFRILNVGSSENMTLVHPVPVCPVIVLVAELQALLDHRLGQQRLLSSDPGLQPQLLLQDILAMRTEILSQPGTFFLSSIALLKGFFSTTCFSLLFIEKEIFLIPPNLFLMDNSGIIGGSFFKIAYCFCTAAGRQPNLDAILAVDTPSCFQHNIFVFSTTVMSLLLPIAKFFAQYVRRKVCVKKLSNFG